MKLVLFDLDETLIKGDSTRLWLKFCIERGLLAKQNLERIDFFHKQYEEERLDMDEFMSFFLKAVKGKDEKLVSALVDEFIQKHIEFYERAKELVKSYEGQRRIVISATADFLVRKIALKLGIEEIIAMRCELVDNKFSGRALGVHTYREGKVLRLKEYLGEDYEKWMRVSYFFSDSINDLALLERVSKPVVCNADAKLLKIAKERNYELLNF